MVQEKDDTLKLTKTELDDAKVVLKKFGGQSEKLDEILASRRIEPSHRGLGASIKKHGSIRMLRLSTVFLEVIE
ncbi:hypothetical protein GOBAR_AA03007 [Gossypium barbadense]|uniref:Uncharacterized protein n=1 Tax=Gossypium barbadense TaxID=3634 RepID=A0A2P5YPL2_GOSBA|nr:hypothetical protein GOBAR_AA03007 [Gossypium barbadense]